MELEAAGDVATPEALTLDVLVDAEQVPNPDSRVTLEEELDQVGVPRARVEWRLADLDRRTLSAAASVLGAEFDRLGLGRLRSDRWITGPDRDWALYVHDVFHHAGTTRMARDPSAGVTDSDCRVHGIANLYVAGSSVFPTSGHANPTLTIVALALRLADWLAGVLA
jgi:choline dehydrogenase-like flavoprotein